MTPVLYIKEKLMAAFEASTKKKVVEVSGNPVSVVNGNGAVQGVFNTQEEAVEFATLHGFKVEN